MIDLLILLVQIAAGMVAFVVLVAAFVIGIYYGLELAEKVLDGIDWVKDKYAAWKEKRHWKKTSHVHQLRWLCDDVKVCTLCDHIVRYEKPTINGRQQ